MKMLLHCIRLRLMMFIILSLCQELASKPYRYFPYKEEYTIEEGETLSIAYYEDTLLKFVYPDSIGKSINTSNKHIYYQRTNHMNYQYNFTKPITLFGDTGWYGCAKYNFDTSINSNKIDNEMDWLYVYVRSNKNLFVKADTDVHLNASVGSSIVIPCRTTWPDLKPILINGNEDELNDVSFDPKIGFTIENLSLEDSNRYKCLIKKDGKEHVVSYVLSVLKRTLPKPKIRVNDLFITRGQDLIMNCTIKMKISTKYVLEWNTPQKNNSRLSTQKFKHLNGNIVRVTSQLTVFNVTDKDEGNYECIIRSKYDIKKIKKNIRIYDPQIKRIELLPESDTLYFQRKIGSDFNLTVYVSAFLDTQIDWFDWEMSSLKLIGNAKYIEYYDSNGFNSSYIKTVCKFKLINVTLDNSVDGTIQARNGYTIEIMNFTLAVIAKPEVYTFENDWESYYWPNERVEFCCFVHGSLLNITWSFLKCPNYPSLENSTIVYLMNATDVKIATNQITTIIMSIEISGKITCEACNNVACDSVTKNIIVSDPVPPFFIKTNMNKTKIRTLDVIAEETVMLQCFAEGMPKPNVTWYKDNLLLKENNQYLFKYNQHELHIKYLTLYDSGNYSCRAYNSIGTNETYQQITVKITKWNILNITLVTSIPILVFILVILAISSIKIYREKKMMRDLMEVGLMHFEEGALERLNPNLTVEDQAELLPYDKKWEFPRDRIILKEQLGCGHFGMVMKAEAIGICKNENISTVAVKMVRRTNNSIYIRSLANELKIMVHLGKHLNVVNLLGAYTKHLSKHELLVIVEYCRFGNLHNYLLRHRNDFINQINLKTGKHDFTIGKDILTRTGDVSNDNSLNANADIDTVTQYSPGTSSNSPKANTLPDYINGSLSQSELGPNYCNDNKNHNSKPICTIDLLSWAFQVARGMEYLSQRKILHGDLAARNILLAEDNVVKICDFGLAKTMYDGNYKKKSNEPVPIKWMAIESIKDRIFSTQSDVWSFGIMLWEFFTLAETPYPDIEIEQQYQKLIEGYRMEQPDYAVDEMYNIILQCWIAKPTLRPSFTELVEMVGNLLEENVRMHYITLNNPYMNINTMDMKSGKNDYLMMMSAPDHMVPSFLDNNGDRNMSLSKDTSDSSYLGMRPDRPIDESELFRSIPHQDIEFALPVSVSKLSSIQKHEEEHNLKPVHE